MTGLNATTQVPELSNSQILRQHLAGIKTCQVAVDYYFINIILRV